MTRTTTSRTALIALLAAALLWAAAPLQSAAPAPAASPAAAPASPTGGFIDHSVLDDADLLPADDPAPLAIAVYGA